ncbi:MAG TPA: alpha/beta hydrolase [Aliidongia sp.]|nr:alpha/beta hydrolase [Aliidongia sp.]
MAPLARHLTLLFIDMRGSGGSSRPADRARMSQTVMADDIDQLRAALGLDTIDLMGHSDGGTIAIEYAERHPEHLRKLALIDARVLGDREGDNIHSYLTLWADDPHYRAAVQEEIKAESNDGPVASDADFEKYLSTVLPLYVSDPVRFAPKLAASFAGTHLSSYAANAQDDAQQSTPRDQTKELGNIKAKTLIINGTVDWICPYQEAQLLHAQIPGSQLSLYANKGHVPWIEDPSRFFPEISAYFRD